MGDTKAVNTRFLDAIREFPCIAILRGLEPENALAIGKVLFDAGFRVIEVPLNSPEPLKSIEILSNHFGEAAIIGAGTVLTASDVDDVHAAGGQIIVSPNANPAVILRTKAIGLISAPGVQTPSEAFAAIDDGADCLKFFPGEALTPSILKAMKAVLPAEIPCLVVGGVTPDKMESYFSAGAAGFGVGSAIFKLGDDAPAVAEKAKTFKAALEKNYVNRG